MAGFTLTDMIWYLAMIESIALSRAHIQISEEVKSGDLAYALCKPYQAARIVLLTVIPAALMGSVPASLFRSFSWTALVGLCAGVVMFMTLALLVYRQGIKRYESGNLMAGRT